MSDRAPRMEDLDAINPLEVYSENTRAYQGALVATLGPEYAFTVLAPDGVTPLAVTCGVPHYPKVWEITAFADKLVAKYPVHYARAMRKLLNRVFEKHQLNRAFIYVRADALWATAWANAMGFSFEGKVRKHGEDGTDHYLFAKVRD